MSGISLLDADAMNVAINNLPKSAGTNRELKMPQRRSHLGAGVGLYLLLLRQHHSAKGRCRFGRPRSSFSQREESLP